MCILYPQPALIVIACPRHRHTIVVTPALIIAALVVATCSHRHAHPRHRHPSSLSPVHRIDAHCCCPPALIVAASALHPPSLRPALIVVPTVRLLSSHLPLLLLPVLVATPTCCSYWLFRLVHNIMNKWTYDGDVATNDGGGC